jgi:hypothetical protein
LNPNSNPQLEKRNEVIDMQKLLTAVLIGFFGFVFVACGTTEPKTMESSPVKQVPGAVQLRPFATGTALENARGYYPRVDRPTGD